MNELWEVIELQRKKALGDRTMRNIVKGTEGNIDVKEMTEGPNIDYTVGNPIFEKKKTFFNI